MYLWNVRNKTMDKEKKDKYKKQTLKYKEQADGCQGCGRWKDG